MQSTRSLFTYLQVCRYINSSSVNSTIAREGRFMNKMMQRGSRSKKKWYDASIDFRKDFINKTADSAARSPSTHTIRRMTVRNKLFMEHITDQISMGDAASIINGAIEITHVEITPDFKHINVFWNQVTNIPISQEALQKCALIIRHELSQLRVIGIVPPIKFVENKQYLIQKEIEEKLAMIESESQDFEPLSYAEQMELAASHVHQTSHKESIINNKSKLNDSELDEPHIELPAMRHDVLGLDHHKIISQIVASMSKSRAAAERRMLDISTNTDDDSHNVTSNKVADFLTKSEQKELFKQFLKERRIEMKRKYRMKKSLNQHFMDNFEEEIDSNENYDNNYDYEDENYENFNEDKK